MKTKIELTIQTAMKNRETVKRNILRVLIGEIERAEQTSAGKVALTDGEIQSIVKKMVMNIKETSNDEMEIKILSEYLPKMLSDGELKSAVDTFIGLSGINTKRGMGIIMQHFKDTYPNRYDGKQLSLLLQSKLQ